MNKQRQKTFAFHTTNPSGRWTWTASLSTHAPTSLSLQPGRLTRSTPTGRTISRWKLSGCSPDPKYIVLAGVQPHLKQHSSLEVGRDLRHGEGLPDEEPSWGDGLVPGGQLQTESCHQQVRTTSACQISKSKSLRDNDNFYILIRSIFYSTFSSFFCLFGFWGVLLGQREFLSTLVDVTILKRGA